MAYTYTPSDNILGYLNQQNYLRAQRRYKTQQTLSNMGLQIPGASTAIRTDIDGIMQQSQYAMSQYQYQQQLARQRAAAYAAKQAQANPDAWAKTKAHADYKNNQQQQQYADAQKEAERAKAYANYDDYNQINSIADILLNIGKYKKEGISGVWDDTLDYLSRPLQAIKTREWNALLINPLQGFGEDLDLAANFVKAITTPIVNNKFQGNYNIIGENLKAAVGLSDYYGIGNRVNFDYDIGLGLKLSNTGAGKWLQNKLGKVPIVNIGVNMLTELDIVDMAFEIISDPVDWFTKGGSSLLNHSLLKGASSSPEVAKVFAKAAKEIGEEEAENILKRTVRSITHTLNQKPSYNINKAISELYDDISFNNNIKQFINNMPLSVQETYAEEYLKALAVHQNRSLIATVNTGLAGITRTASAINSVKFHLGTAELGLVHPVELLVKKYNGPTLHYNAQAYNELITNINKVLDADVSETTLKQFNNLHLNPRMTPKKLDAALTVFEKAQRLDDAADTLTLRTLLETYRDNNNVILQYIFKNRADITQQEIKELYELLGDDLGGYKAATEASLEHLRSLTKDEYLLEQIDEIYRDIETAFRYAGDRKLYTKRFDSVEEIEDTFVKPYELSAEAKTSLNSYAPEVADEARRLLNAGMPEQEAIKQAVEKYRKRVDNTLFGPNAKPNKAHVAVVECLLDRADEVYNIYDYITADIGEYIKASGTIPVELSTIIDELFSNDKSTRRLKVNYATDELNKLNNIVETFIASPLINELDLDGNISKVLKDISEIIYNKKSLNVEETKSLIENLIILDEYLRDEFIFDNLKGMDTLGLFDDEFTDVAIDKIKPVSTAPKVTKQSNPIERYLVDGKTEYNIDTNKFNKIFDSNKLYDDLKILIDYLDNRPTYIADDKSIEFQDLLNKAFEHKLDPDYKVFDNRSYSEVLKEQLELASKDSLTANEMRTFYDNNRIIYNTKVYAKLGYNEETISVADYIKRTTGKDNPVVAALDNLAAFNKSVGTAKSELRNILKEIRKGKTGDYKVYDVRFPVERFQESIITNLGLTNETSVKDLLQTLEDINDFIGEQVFETDELGKAVKQWVAYADMRVGLFDYLNRKYNEPVTRDFNYKKNSEVAKELIPSDEYSKIVSNKLHDAHTDTELTLRSYQELLKLNEQTVDPSRVLVFDLETTSKDIADAEIVQLVIRDGNNNILFPPNKEYIKPDIAKSWIGAEQATHIGPEQVKNSLPFSAYIDEIQNIFDTHDVIVGYNHEGYDIPILKRYGINIHGTSYDVMKEYKIYRDTHFKSLDESAKKKAINDAVDRLSNYYELRIGDTEEILIANDVLYNQKAFSYIVLDEEDAAAIAKIIKDTYIDPMIAQGYSNVTFSPQANRMLRCFKDVKDLLADSTKIEKTTKKKQIDNAAIREAQYHSIDGKLNGYIDNIRGAFEEKATYENDYKYKYYVLHNSDGVVKSVIGIEDGKLIEKELDQNGWYFMRELTNSTMSGKKLNLLEKFYPYSDSLMEYIVNTADNIKFNDVDIVQDALGAIERHIINKPLDITEEYFKELQATPELFDGFRNASNILFNKYLEQTADIDKTVIDITKIYNTDQSALLCAKSLFDLEVQRRVNFIEERVEESGVVDYYKVKTELALELRDSGIDDMTLTYLLDDSMIMNNKTYYPDNYTLAKLNDATVGEKAFSDYLVKDNYPDETDRVIYHTLDDKDMSIYFRSKTHFINAIKESVAYKTYCNVFKNPDGSNKRIPYKQIEEMFRKDKRARLAVIEDYMVHDIDSFKTFLYQDAPGRIYITENTVTAKNNLNRLLDTSTETFNNNGIAFEWIDNSTVCIYLTEKVDPSTLKQLTKTNTIKSNKVMKDILTDRRGISGHINNNRLIDSNKVTTWLRDNDNIGGAAYSYLDFMDDNPNAFSFNKTSFDNMFFGDTTLADSVYGYKTIWDMTNVEKVLTTYTNNIKSYQASQLFFNSTARPKLTDIIKDAPDDVVHNWFKNNKSYTCMYYIVNEKTGMLEPKIIELANKKNIATAKELNAIPISRLEATNIIKEYRSGNRILNKCMPLEIFDTLVSCLKASYLMSPGWLMRNFTSTTIKAILDAAESNTGTAFRFIPDVYTTFRQCCKEMQRYEECYTAISEWGKEHGFEKYDQLQVTERLKTAFFKENTEFSDFKETFREIDEWQSKGYTSTLTSTLKQMQDNNIIKGMGFMNTMKNLEDIVDKTNQKKIKADPNYKSSVEYKTKMAEEVAKAVAWKNPVMSVITGANNSVEAYARYFTYKWNMKQGSDMFTAAEHVRRTHFDYDSTTDFSALMNDVVPFLNFKIANTKYWIEEMYNNPIIARAIIAQYKANGLFDLSTEDKLDNDTLVSRLLAGAMPIGDTGLYFKLNGDYIDALQTAMHPITEITQSILGVSTIKKYIQYKEKYEELAAEYDQWKKQLALYRQFEDALDDEYKRSEDSINKQQSYYEAQLEYYGENRKNVFLSLIPFCDKVKPFIDDVIDASKEIDGAQFLFAKYFSGLSEEEQTSLQYYAKLFPSIFGFNNKRYYYSYGNLNTHTKDYVTYLDALERNAREGWSGVSQPIEEPKTYYAVGFDSGKAYLTTDSNKVAEWLSKGGTPLNDDTENLQTLLKIDKSVYGSTKYQDYKRAYNNSYKQTKTNNDLLKQLNKLTAQTSTYRPRQISGYNRAYTHAQYTQMYPNYDAFYGVRTQTKTQTRTRTETQIRTRVHPYTQNRFNRPINTRRK